MQLGLELLIDHSTNEVIEPEIVFLLTLIVEWGLRVGCTFELGVKTKAVLIEESALLFGGRVGKFIGIDKGRCTLCRFSKML